MSSSDKQQQPINTNMSDASDPVHPRHSQHTNTSDGGKVKAKTEVRVPVLLQWKDREMADDFAKLMMSGTGHESEKTKKRKGDVNGAGGGNGASGVDGDGGSVRHGRSVCLIARTRMPSNWDANRNMMVIRLVVFAKCE